MGKDVIIACDFSSAIKLGEFLRPFGERSLFLKVGMELFYSEGPSVVKELKERGHRIFLDLKLHDIPNTVRKSMKVLSAMDIDMCTVHAAGGIEMMKAAGEGAGSSKIKIMAVTQLTSTDEEQLHRELLISRTMEEAVLAYAENAYRAGLAGVISSPLEAAAIHRACGNEFLTVTPGIRFAGGSTGDQKRTSTPADARELGADYIVVGRSITEAKDPVGAYEKCLKDFM